MLFPGFPDPKDVTAQENIPSLDSVPKARKTVSRWMLTLTIVLALTQLVTMGLVMLLDSLNPAWVANAWIQTGLNLSVLYVMGFAALYLALANTPATPPKRQRLPVRILILCFFFLLGLVFVGAVLGDGVAAVLDAITGRSSTDPISEAMGSWTSLLPNALLAVFVAPVAEEFFFRKLLLDRIGRYGEGFAVAVSAVAFGLYHGNLYQLFYTALVGMLLAFVYLRSGNVWYPILLHAAMNAFTGVLASLVSLKTGGVWEALSDVYSVMLYLGLLLTVAVLPGLRGYGKRPAEEPLPRGSGFSAAAGNVGMIVFLLYSIAVMVLTFLASAL